MQKQALGKGLGALIPDLSALDDKEKRALGIHEIELDRIVPNETGGVEDPTDPTVICVGGLTTADDNSDTIMDVFTSVLPGQAVCFDIFPEMNTTVPPTEEPQLYSAEIRVIGNSVTVLDTRIVYFLVPPESYIIGPQ